MFSDALNICVQSYESMPASSRKRLTRLREQSPQLDNETLMALAHSDTDLEPDLIDEINSWGK